MLPVSSFLELAFHELHFFSLQHFLCYTSIQFPLFVFGIILFPKNFADSRIRVKGRFVKKEDQAAMMLSMRLGANKEQNISEAEDEEEKGMDEVEAEVEAEVEVDNNAGVDGYDDEDCECDVDIDIEVDVDENDVSLIKKKSSEITVTLTGKGSVAGTLDCDRDAVDNVGRKSRDCSSSRHITEEPDLTAGSKDDINFFNLCGEKGREGGDEDDDDDVRDDDVRDENGNVDINRIPNNSSISGFES